MIQMNYYWLNCLFWNTRWRWGLKSILKQCAKSFSFFLPETNKTMFDQRLWVDNPELLNLHKRLLVQSLIFANVTPMSTICQVYYLIVGGMFYKKVGRLWRVSDCEELVSRVKPILHFAPLLKTTWSNTSPVKHWQAPLCSTTPLLFNIIKIRYN